jgi:Ca2+-binding EF-hand superfamily protein
LDFHRDGEVNYSEFLAASMSSLNFIKEEKIWSAFRHFESSEGFITSESVINSLKANDLNCDEKGIKKFFDELKLSGKKLNFEEFKKLVIPQNV